MKRSLFIVGVILCGLYCSACAQEHLDKVLYPAIEPRDSGYFAVDEQNYLYYELVGNPEGIPVIFLHGGPGGMATPANRRFYDPADFNILLFDQRGAGRSKPAAVLEGNNTQALVEDINKLREHVGFTGPAMIVGGSWGSTLAVAYAETYPELVSGLVLRGIFLASKAEIDHFYHGGVVRFFPENFYRLQSIIPEPDKLDYPTQLFEMTQSDDAETREKAVNGWAWYELRMVRLDMTDEQCDHFIESYDMTNFSVIENYFMMNKCFLEDRQLIDNTDKIAHIPTYIINGRYDAICPPITAIELAGKMKNAKLDIVIAAHSWDEPVMAKNMIKGIKWVASQIKK